MKLKERHGLMKARVKAAEVAEGEVIVILDSHIEVQPAWLEPMLSRIKEDRTTVLMPVIDSVISETFGFTSATQIG
jgi:polypeptide N-acetylgalactosaminyltransferase